MVTLFWVLENLEISGTISVRCSGGYHGQLHLDEDLREVRLALDEGVVDRCGGLAAVDDLKVVDSPDPGVAVRAGPEFHLGRGRADAVVVGEEALRRMDECLPDSAVHRAPELQERTYVELKEPCSVLAVDAGEYVAAHDGEEDGVVLVRLRGGEARQRFLEVDRDGLVEHTGGGQTVESGKVPYLERDRNSLVLGRRELPCGCDVVGDDEDPDSRGGPERLLHSEAHVVGLERLLQLFAESAADS
jgi:hypothetical protein